MCVLHRLSLAAAVLWLLGGMLPGASPGGHDRRTLRSHVHAAGSVCVLKAIPRNMFTTVPPPDEFLQARRAALPHPNAVAITVNYNGTWPSEARAAFQYAVDIWKSQLTSSVPVTIDAAFRGDLGEGVLGSAGPANFDVYASGDPPPPPPPSGVLVNTWYAIALMNKLWGYDRLPSDADITANFSSTFAWYYGTDGMTPADKYDFVTVVLHELCHGLGYLGFGWVDPDTGLGYVRNDWWPSIWEHFVENGTGQTILSFDEGTFALAGQLLSDNLYWNGSNAVAGNGGTKPRLYAPVVWNQGSSYSHLNEATYAAGDPNSLMTPAIGYAEAIHNPGPTTRGMFADMGWATVTPSCAYTVAPTSASPAATGGSATVSVTTTAGCNWTAASNSVFITITAGASGTGSGTVAYSVASNTGAARSGTMTVAGQTVTINQAAASAVPGSFETDHESWRAGSFPDGGPYDQVVGQTTPSWHASVGNPGGAIYLIDPGAGTFFFGAPDALLGDKSGYYGGQLRFDLRVAGSGSPFDEADVILLGGGLLLVYDLPAAPTSSWSTFTVPLTESGWKVNSLTGSPATRVQFQSALANILALRIRGEFIGGTDTGFLDNVSLSPGSVTLTPVPASLNFGAVNNGGTLASATPPQTVTVQQSGGTATAWTATPNVSWLTVTTADAAGTGTGAFTVTLNNTGNVLPVAGTLTGTITIAAPGAQANPTIAVRVTTYPPGLSMRSYGQVDTPAQNATGVQGAIGVTGWALDDLGVAGVKIYRNCLAWENQAACQVVGGNNLVFVGDAAFLAGARPDLETAFPTVPFRHRAGWGFLMLTNMLPHVTGQQPYGGQGSVSLYVYATDQEGQLTLLGRTYVETPAQPTVIAMNNDAIAKPFGAIDTPGQGAIVSGVLPNFGWVLTPDSNTVADATDILIPTNGSTMFVFVDSVATAAVAYNHCRGSVGTPPGAGVFCNDDISQIFGNPTPQPAPPPFTARTSNQTRYRNLDAARGAIGAYNINTAALTNGLHTIAWSVTDSAGRTEGIGSRFFQVLNTGADAARVPGSGIRPFDALALAQAALSPAEGRDPGAAPQEREGADSGGSGGSATPATVGRVRRTRPVSAGSASRPYRTEQRITDEVLARVGFDLNAPFVPLTPDADGVYHVRLGDLDRLELDLGPVIDGYLDNHSRSDFPMGPREITPGVSVRRDLPIGATLDTDAGLFAWAPPAGYLGTYRLAFGRARSPNVPDVGVAPDPGSRIPSPDHADIVIDVTIAPRTPSAPGESAIRMHLDTPTDGATLSGPFTVAGWALDPQAGLGAGVGAVHVWAQRTDVAGAPPVFLGAAALGFVRPDVAAAHGPQFDRAGFELNGDTARAALRRGSGDASAPNRALEPGTYDLTAYAWNTRTARWEDARTVHVTVK